MNALKGHRGRITVNVGFLADIKTMRQIMDGVVVFHVDTNQMQGTITYWLDHPELDEIIIGEVVPHYDVTFERHGDALMRSFTRMPMN